MIQFSMKALSGDVVLIFDILRAHCYFINLNSYVTCSAKTGLKEVKSVSVQISDDFFKTVVFE